MSYECAACKRSFAEPGFCPFDGTQLSAAKAGANAETLVAQGHADTAPTPKLDPSEGSTAVEAKGPTMLQAAVQPPPDVKVPVAGPLEKTNLIKSFSAAHRDDETDAMASMLRRVSEYDALIGETLDGRYLVQRKLGEGGMGVVFAVKHTVIERPLAIKVLKKKVMRDEATVKRFIQEARAASRIGHPNIVDVTDFGTTADGTTYQVMELIDGTTLSKTIKTTAPLPFERVLRISTQIARALVAAHAKGIVHRDLKPENVFLTEREGRPDFVKIVDFGIAKISPVDGTQQAGPRLTRQGSVFGTPEYMAPEQAAGKNDTDHRVDIYALGTILYEMLVGKVPHKGDSMVRTIAMQMLDPIVPPSKVKPELGIPPELESIIMKALTKDRDKRYQTMAELLTALEGVSLDSPTMPETSPPEMGLPSPAPSTVRRNKPPTRPLHEPEFVASPTAPVSFSAVYDDAPPEELDRRRSKLPILLAGLVMLGLGAGGTVFLIRKMQGTEVATNASPARDAGLIAHAPSDAAVEEAPVDAEAIAEVPVDAAVTVTQRPGRDAGVGSTALTTTTGVRPDKKGNVTIEVLTRPGDANVFIGPNFRGPSGVKITEKYGTRVKIECKTDRMKGSVEVAFDGNLTAVMCTAARDRFCVPGLKNPYDDCEEDPNASP